jgi:hypothetical protein
MQILNPMTLEIRKSWGKRTVRSPVAAALGALFLFSAIATTAAAATPQTATDAFIGAVVTAPGQTSPISVDPTNMTVRADGAIGFGYIYQAKGQAYGQVPGSFTYQEHGYLYFTNPRDPSTMVGSRFASGAFSLTPAKGGPRIQIADTSPQTYTSGIQTVVTKMVTKVRTDLGGLFGTAGQLTYGYFTFTNPYGTYTGYATPDFMHFYIQIKFALP